MAAIRSAHIGSLQNFPRYRRNPPLNGYDASQARLRCPFPATILALQACPCLPIVRDGPKRPGITSFAIVARRFGSAPLARRAEPRTYLIKGEYIVCQLPARTRTHGNICGHDEHHEEVRNNLTGLQCLNQIGGRKGPCEIFPPPCVKLRAGKAQRKKPAMLATPKKIC
jgi:hypothetical protein